MMRLGSSQCLGRLCSSAVAAGFSVPAGCWLPRALQGARGEKKVLQAGNSLGNWWQEAAHPRLSEVTGLQRGLWSSSACRSGGGVVPQRGSWHWCVFKPAFSTLEVVRTVLPGSFLFCGVSSGASCPWVADKIPAQHLGCSGQLGRAERGPSQPWVLGNPSACARERFWPGWRGCHASNITEVSNQSNPSASTSA